MYINIYNILNIGNMQSIFKYLIIYFKLYIIIYNYNMMKTHTRSDTCTDCLCVARASDSTYMATHVNLHKNSRASQS